MQHVRSYYKMLLLQRWFVDGSVQCFTGGHLPLAIVAILILMCYMVLIIFVMAVVLKKVKVSHILMCAVGSYCDIYTY